MASDSQARIDLTKLSDEELVSRRTYLEWRVAKLERERREVEQKLRDMTSTVFKSWKNRGYGFAERREVNALSREEESMKAQVSKINMELRIRS